MTKQIYTQINPDELNSKLTQWKNPPTITDLKNDYTESESNHKLHVTNVNEWLDVLDGILDTQTVDGRSRIQPKVARKLAEWRYASLEMPFISSPDIFDVNPATHMDVLSAKQNNLVLNKQFRIDIPKIRFINDLVRTAVNTGTVIVKLGWEEKLGLIREEYMKPVFVTNPEEISLFLEQKIAENPESISPEQAQQVYEQLVMQIEETGEPIQVGEELAIREVEKPITNKPVLEIRDSREIIIDPTCEGELDNARFVIDTYISDLSTLKEDGRYKNLEYIDIASNGPSEGLLENTDNNLKSIDFEFTDEPRKKLQVYEYWGYWDIDGDGIVKPIVVTYIGDIIIRMEENPFPDNKLPFVIIKYVPTSDLKSIYGQPDAELLKDNQKIIGAITRGALDLFGRSANAQQGTAAGWLDAINEAKFKKGLDFQFNPGLGDISNNYFMTAYPEIPRSVFEMYQWLNNDSETLTGIKAFTNDGISGEALGSSVGGIKSALDATSKREFSILSRISQGLIEIGKKIIAMNSVWLSDEEIIRITDDEFVTIKRDDLAGQFDLTISISTAEEDNAKAQELSFLLQTLGNTTDFTILKIVLMKLFDLRKLPDVVQAIQDYEPQPDPLAVEEAQLRIELLKAQIANEQAKAEENTADIALKQAKTQTELSKTRLNTSNADTVDLNYVNRASGLEQDQELEKLLIKGQKPNESK